MTKQEIIDRIYPIGSGYITTSNIDLSSILGGTWEKIPGNYILKISNGDISINDGDGFISTDSDKTNTSSNSMTKSQCPSHTHEINGSFNGISGSSQYIMVPNVMSESDLSNYSSPIELSGSGGSGHYHAMSHTHEYEPINIKVYLWKRIG